MGAEDIFSKNWARALGRPNLFVLQPRGDGLRVSPSPPLSKHFKESVLVALPSFLSPEELLGPGARRMTLKCSAPASSWG